MRYALGSANHYEVCAAVLLPARLVVLGAEWALLTVARGLYAVLGNPQTHHVFLYRCGAKISQSEIVFLASALVTMPLDREADLGMQTEEFGILLQRLPRILTNIRLVVVKERVFDGALEECV